MPDNHKNFAYSTVATAPSPATSGLSLTLATGDGTKFPTSPFNCTVWPTSASANFPTSGNAEIIRVTAVAGDVFTIVRAQEGSVARTIVVGDQIAATITAKTLTDVEAPSLTTLSATSATSLSALYNADFTTPYQYLTMTAAASAAVIIFQAPSVGLAGVKSTVIYIDALSSNTRTFGFPGWKFIGAGAPTNLPANKIALLSLTTFFAAETGVVAAWAAQP